MEEEDEFLYGGGSNDSKTAPVRKEPTKEAEYICFLLIIGTAAKMKLAPPTKVILKLS